MAALANLTAPTASLVNPFQYTARESDTETGLYYYRARYYDPGTGRFLNEDPVRFAGGKNYYLYVSNNPAKRKDSLGLASHYWGWRRIGGNSDVWKQQRPVEFRALYGRGRRPLREGGHE